ncbi:protein phosphatase regulatory subunit Ekc1 [Schizosaccharomyces japonicus yFS275]|uniref:Protein phosphatase regulatory subunit Ekc1 n=1 Tax=Schizosaccharomyces japonicus (strain yFS275 / FY16936) TaxID=402676 RepID=B6K7D0_SCHJY|nr:protein phosphatase regulatory subunit Ekc1 [Schizosaccharomyces japonicus yFS275]EEB09434.1 protein phosphatase regulatory subunit Ekc1 [Schizosaccharomyces japonicus yFS275]
MFWRFGHGFGFQSSSAIEAILSKPEEEIQLKKLLEEPGVLDECKSHNPKLIEYLCKPTVLNQLVDYILEPEDEEPQDGGYEEPETTRLSFIASEILSSDVWSICEACVENHELLAHLWTFLDNENPLNPLQASYFAKINEHFLDKKTEQLVAFIQSIDNLVEKILRHVETSAIMDLLLKFISMDRCETPVGIADWLHSQGLVQRLLQLLNPNMSPDIQSTVADVIKAIIAISANSNEPGVIGPNSLSRELVSEETIGTMIQYMTDVSAPNSTTSLVNGVSIVIELIRKNNSDYDVTPILQMPLHTFPPTTRDPIYLGTMLRLFSEKIPVFQNLLMHPKDTPETMPTSFGQIKPLGFERFRVCELYAELLHCSNMSLLSDPNAEAMVLQRNHLRDFLIRHNKCPRNPRTLDDDSGFQAGKFNENETQDTSFDGQNQSQDENMTEADQESVVSTQATDIESATKLAAEETNFLEDIVEDGERFEPLSTETLQEKVKGPVVGDLLKIKFIENNVITIILDQFFEYPWNNFLHNVVYDVVQQVLNGPMDKGHNYALAFDMFTQTKITEKIVNGQRISDEETAKPNGFRPGYMGHLTIIAEEVIKFVERYQNILHQDILDMVNKDSWQHFVNETLAETRARDNQLLGGLEPSMVGYLDDVDGEMLDANNLPEMQFALEQELESNSSDDDIVEMHRELSRDSDTDPDDQDSHLAREMSRRLSMDSSNSDDDDSRDHFAQYMSEEMSNDPSNKSDSSSDSDDDDDDVVGWVPRGKQSVSRSGFFLNEGNRDDDDSDSGDEDEANDDSDDDDDDDREFAEDEYRNGLLLFPRKNKDNEGN